MILARNVSFVYCFVVGLLHFLILHGHVFGRNSFTSPDRLHSPITATAFVDFGGKFRPTREGIA